MTADPLPAAPTTDRPGRTATGIGPLDQRIGGLPSGGSYLVVGAPGPAKMVAVLQFVHEGVRRGERCVLLCNNQIDGALGVARAWGFELEDAWRDGRLQVIGFRDDFELRALRSIAPEEVLEELDELIVGDPDRVAVDPGSLFLTGGARTLLGAAFVGWTRERHATVLTTFPVDGDPTALPSAADWLSTATTGRLVLARREGGLEQLTWTSEATGEAEETVTLQLEPGEGLVRPKAFPARRGMDRGDVDPKRMLLVSLEDEHASDLEAWADSFYDADVVAEPFEAVAQVQREHAYGSVLIHATRRHVRAAVQACRAMRPLTRAAIVFASDEQIRSSDRVQLLEAGADDCMSGGLDFRELGLRIQQAIETGARPVPAQDPVPEPAERAGGRLTRSELANEIQRRAASRGLAFFCVLHVTAPGLSAEVLEELMVELVRSDEGDLVSGGDDGSLALLQGAREAQLAPFLGRIRARLREAGASDLTVRVLSHPADASEIDTLLGIAVGDAR